MYDFILIQVSSQSNDQKKRPVKPFMNTNSSKADNNTSSSTTRELITPSLVNNSSQNSQPLFVPSNSRVARQSNKQQQHPPKRTTSDSSNLRSGYHSDSVLIGLNRQASTDSSSQLEIEEEKIQQLRSVSGMVQ